MYSWLKHGGDEGIANGSQHKGAMELCSTFEERSQAREQLKFIDGSQELLSLERPQREDEGEEPRGCP